jgi:hypothetical protein
MGAEYGSPWVRAAIDNRHVMTIVSRQENQWRRVRAR